MNILMRRMAALTLDSLLIILITFAIHQLTGKNISDIIYNLDFNLFYILLVVTLISYFTIQESIVGFTIGKKIFGLRVVDINGNPLTFSKAITRNFFRIIDHVIIGYVLIIVRKDNRRLGDIIAGTKISQQKH